MEINKLAHERAGGVLLSVCIPTYNFGRFIGGTLDSIISQATPELEVLVVDGASTDNTEEVVREFQIRFPSLRYHRLPKKGGIDQDMAKSVELATGDYVWLFSADDRMRDGAISEILEEIRSGHDLYLCGFTLCTFEMDPVGPHPILKIDGPKVFELSNPSQRKEYFEKALTTTAFFSFMGSLVCRRDRWKEGRMDERFQGSCFAHVARLFGLIPNGLSVKILPNPFLLKRDDNDSFSERGIVRRVGVSVEGYHRLSESYFGRESFEAFHIRRVVRNEYPLLNLLYVKRVARDLLPETESKHLDHLVDLVYLDPLVGNRLRHFVYRLAPVPLLRPAERIFKGIRRIIRGR